MNSLKLSKGSFRNRFALGILVIVVSWWTIYTTRHMLARLSLALSEHPNIRSYIGKDFQEVANELGEPDQICSDRHHFHSVEEEFVLHRPGLPWKTRTLTLVRHDDSSFSFEDALLSDWTTYGSNGR